MNTELVRQSVLMQPRRRRPATARASTSIKVRTATAAEAPVLHALIQAHLLEGRLLPRDLDELTVHASRFVVAIRRGRIVGCAELAPLSRRVAEVRSLVVDHRARLRGVGRALVSELERRAGSDGYEQLCVFAHDAAYFVRRGFSLVPHTWLPEKIAHDCAVCPLFRRCGQHALVLSVARG
jgi:amino-acid N-acetyltransferase